jgi:hypothetical protein
MLSKGEREANLLALSRERGDSRLGQSVWIEAGWAAKGTQVNAHIQRVLMTAWYPKKEVTRIVPNIRKGGKKVEFHTPRQLWNRGYDIEFWRI